MNHHPKLKKIGIKLKEWGESEPSGEQETIDWLTGSSLPALGGQDEPYEWIFRGLETLDNPRATGRRLAVRLAEFVESKPDERRPGNFPEQTLANLLMLCAGLNEPDELAEPLYRMYKRAKLSGEWRGIDLCGALCSALTMNQMSPIMEDDWMRLACGEHHCFTNDYIVAFYGAVMMPESPEARDKPHYKSILNVLDRIVRNLDRDYLRDDETKVEILRRLTRKVNDRYLNSEIYNYMGAYYFDKKWPNWTKRLLPAAYRTREIDSFALSIPDNLQRSDSPKRVLGRVLTLFIAAQDRFQVTLPGHGVIDLAETAPESLKLISTPLRESFKKLLRVP